MNTAVNRVFGTALALGSLLIGTCAAHGQYAPTQTTPRTSNPVPASVRLPQSAEQRLAAMDKDGNGTISEDEYEDSITNIFRDLDADHNNRVSADELSSASAPQHEGMLSPADRIRRIDMLPEPWRTFTLVNPVVYLVSGMRWSFYGISDVNVGLSAAAILGFLVLCLLTVWWIFRTGYKLKA